MTELDQEVLQILLTNQNLLNAVKKLFSQATETNKPQIMDSDDNALLGERYRAYDYAKNIIDSAFTSLESYRKKEKVEKTINRAR